MKKLQLALMLFIAVIVLLVISIFTVPTFINWENNKGIVENLAEDYLGYKVKINGDLQVQLVPNPKIYAENIVLEPQSSSDKIVKIEHVMLTKKLSDLFILDFLVDDLIINRPQINLTTDEDGKNNWEPIKVKNSNYYSRKIKSALSGLMRFANVTIENGSISYENKKTGDSSEILNIYGTIKTDNISSINTMLKTNVDGRNEVLNVTADIKNIDGIRLSGKLTSQEHDILIKGLLNNISNLNRVQFVGKLDAKFEDGNKFKLNNNLFKLKEKYLDLTALEITSEINVSKNELEMSMIDLNSKFNKLKGSFNLYKESDDITSSIKLDIDKIYVKKDDTVEKRTGEIQWSDDLLDFSFANNLRINTSIICLECTYGNRTFYQINLKANLENNNLIVSQLNLKTDKEGYIKLTANAGLNSPVGFEVKAESKDFPMHTLLPAYITKTSNFELDGAVNFSGSGSSLKALVGNLSGSVNVDLKKILLREIDDRNVKGFTNSLLLGNKNPDVNTKINNVNFNGSIRNGVLRTSDINFVLSGYATSAKGKVDLANLTVNYRVEPEQLTRENLGVVVSGNVNSLDVISDKITPKGVIDGFNRLVTTQIVKKAKRKEIKTFFDYDDTGNLEQNVNEFLFK